MTIHRRSDSPTIKCWKASCWRKGVQPLQRKFSWYCCADILWVCGVHFCLLLSSAQLKTEKPFILIVTNGISRRPRCYTGSRHTTITIFPTQVSQDANTDIHSAECFVLRTGFQLSSASGQHRPRHCMEWIRMTWPSSR